MRIARGPLMGRLGGAIVIALLAGLTVVATRLATPTDAASIALSESRASVLAAVENQYLALGSDDNSAIEDLYTGPALAEMQKLRSHIRDLIGAATDYPGRMSLTNIHVASVEGDYATTMSFDILAHARLENMRHGRTVDFSESDIEIRAVVVHDGGTWKVSALRQGFAPGYSP